MEICAFASGSSGNCFYVENDGKAVLIDAGISCKRICESLAAIKKSPEKVKAIFITHEHCDHIKGADVFARQFNVPIYATKKTAQNCFLCSDEDLINYIKNNETMKIAGMRIEAFPKSHSAADPVSYSIIKGKKISIMTDIGHACKNVVSNVSDSDFLAIESNHDEMLLESGPYPYFLKKWIASDIGHLSNFHSAICVLEHASAKLNHVLLSHLSKINNKPEIALDTFNLLLKERKDLKPRISVSGRDAQTPLFKV